MPHYPTVIIGAGPIGLAAAAHLSERQQDFLVVESGPNVAHNIRDWGHVRLFSPWRYLIDPASERLLARGEWQPPNLDDLPTGLQLVESYLEPLSLCPELRTRLRTSSRVLSVTRVGHDRMKDGTRQDTPFRLLIETPNGRQRLLAGAVIDASGTWASPNPMGAEGVPASGEREARSSIQYGVPLISRERFGGKRVLVVGSGHSAIHSLLQLADLASTDVRIAWAVRRSDPSSLWGGGDNDELPARGALGRRIHDAVRSGVITILTSFSIGSLVRNEEGLDVIDTSGTPRCNVDEIIVSTGARPDHEMTRELRLSFDLPTEAVHSLGPLIDPNHHSCGSVTPHGFTELAHPGEPNFYTVGMKSYGRAPTFLMLTGYEQVRSIAAAIAGDLEAARRVELTLPQTGVCSSDGASTEGACC